MAILPTIQARIQSTDDGAIMSDAAAAAGSGADEFRSEWFDAAYWRAAGAAATQLGGRGGVLRVRAHVGSGHDGSGHAANWIVRHYRRGGMAARLMGDRYLWSGAERTRGFAEFRLLAQLRELGLNVPAPIAARFQRSGMHYRADLITAYIDDSTTLAEALRANSVDAEVAQRVGATLGQFHAAGVYHADLNAHNIMLCPRGVWLIDFDRGALRSPAHAWQARNLARLRRSLLKLGAANQGSDAFDTQLWKPLLAGYAREIGKSPEGASLRSMQ